jgi:UDP-galactopyranose mutase
MHSVKGLIDGQLVPIPFKLNSIHQVFPKTIVDRLKTNSKTIIYNFDKHKFIIIILKSF